MSHPYRDPSQPATPSPTALEKLRLAISRGEGVWEAIFLVYEVLVEHEKSMAPADTALVDMKQVETWLRRWRDRIHPDQQRSIWLVLDQLLDDFRMHRDTGKRLSECTTDEKY